MSKKKTDLDFVTTKELLEEVCKRYDHVVFGALKNLSSKEKRADEIYMNQGNLTVCTGIVERLCEDLAVERENIREQMEDDGEEDDED